MYQDSSVTNRRIGKTGCLTGTNMERLLQVPGNFTIYASKRNTLDDVTLGKIDPISVVYGALSWITEPSFLRNKIALSKLLEHNMHTFPKEGGFVTAHLFQRILGKQILKLENLLDAVTVPPRVKRDLIPVVDRLKEIFACSTMTDGEKNQAARDALAPLQGDNYSNYVPPTTADLGENAVVLFNELMALDCRHTILTDFGKLNALLEQEEGQLLVDTASREDIFPGFFTVVRLKSGHQL
jgi:hypothetical protein